MALDLKIGAAELSLSVANGVERISGDNNEELTVATVKRDPVTGGITSVTPRGIPYILAQNGTPISIAPSGTMGANGAVTLGTALNVTYSGGLWLYLPAGAAYAGSDAGFYWTVMSSTTAGTVYDDIYVPGTNEPDIPDSPTAIVGAGPGAFTGETAEITAYQKVVPGGAMGKHGRILFYVAQTWTNSAGAKTLKRYLAGGNIINSIRTTNTAIRMLFEMVNAGTESKQVHYSGNASLGINTVTSSIVAQSVDTSIDWTVLYTLQTAVATDFVGMDNMLMEVYPS